MVKLSSLAQYPVDPLRSLAFFFCWFIAVVHYVINHLSLLPHNLLSLLQLLFLFLTTFSHQPWLVVFHRCQSDGKFLQVSRTLRSYSDRSQQFCSLNGLDSSSNFKLFLLPFQSFRTVPSSQTTIGITVSFMFLYFFLVLWQDVNSSTASRAEG